MPRKQSAIVPEATDAEANQPDLAASVDQPEVPSTPEPAAQPAASFVVRALVSFGEAGNKSYKPGDVVPWNQARAEHYAARGLVEIIEG